jgi:hypothetical protein
MVESPSSESLPRGESAAHLELKRLAAEWALQHRLSLCATEVALPRCNYRADVAAATPRITARNALTAVFECKASRTDFLRDAADETTLREELAALTERLARLRELIGQHRPDLRRSDELFPEFEAIDVRGIKHETHRRLTALLRAAQAKLLDGTKFSKLARWRCSSLMYLVSGDGLIAPHELPEGWGHLVKIGSTLQLRSKPVLNPTAIEHRIAFLERIAASARRDCARGLGLVTWRESKPSELS